LKESGSVLYESTLSCGCKPCGQKEERREGFDADDAVLSWEAPKIKAHEVEVLLLARESDPLTQGDHADRRGRKLNVITAGSLSLSFVEKGHFFRVQVGFKSKNVLPGVGPASPLLVVLDLTKTWKCSSARPSFYF